MDRGQGAGGRYRELMCEGDGKKISRDLESTEQSVLQLTSSHMV